MDFRKDECMKRWILVAMTILTLTSCTEEEQEPKVHVPEPGSEDFSLIMDADDPLGEVERRLKVAILQQENEAFSHNNLTVEKISEEEREEAENNLLAYFYMDVPDIYFALEDTNEFSLTIVTEEAAGSLGDNFNDFINIFIRASDPTIDLDEGRQAASIASRLSSTNDQYNFFQTDFVSIEYSSDGFIPYADTHFTNEFSEETLFYSSIPLSELPNEQ